MIHLLENVNEIPTKGNPGLDQEQKEDCRTVNQSGQIWNSVYVVVEGDAARVEELYGYGCQWDIKTGRSS